MTPEYVRTYLPAAGYDWTLPLYGPIVKLLGGDKARQTLLDQAELQDGYRVLEIGCGTGHPRHSEQAPLSIATFIIYALPFIALVAATGIPRRRVQLYAYLFFVEKDSLR